MNDYLAGKKLYGDDFSFEQIQKWYEDESEGYADLGSKDISKYLYGYHEINKLHGLNKLKGKHFEHVLGFGSAWGHEFEPIIEKISQLTIIEPSENLRSKKIGGIIPTYVKPDITGNLRFDDNSFDLITCFGTLHHIPNVSFVLSELIRVLKPSGLLLLREPIISMGDWTAQRKGLTKHERGIPIFIFDKLFSDSFVKVIHRGYCFTMTSLFQRKIGKFFKKPIYSYKSYAIFDKYISALLKNNVKYHALSKINRIAPSNIFYVIKK
jgi:SAM-dependent methyltransferase